MTTEISDEVATKLEALAIRRGTYALEPLTRIQKVIATRLTEVVREVPTFPLSIDIAIDALVALRAQFNEENPTRISLNDLMIKACALALQEIPTVNSSYTPLGLVRHRHADVAMAVATDVGLMTPILFAAEEKAITQISTEARDLAKRARAHRLHVDEYVGGTFTISNLGMYEVTRFE
jgi:pyruvate dehydrogenase E2 component (dihydrolipoamide acetyltransferase)